MLNVFLVYMGDIRKHKLQYMFISYTLDAKVYTVNIIYARIYIYILPYYIVMYTYIYSIHVMPCNVM